MSDVLGEIAFLIMIRMIQLGVWLVLCLGITAVAAVLQWISKKKLIRWIIKIAVAVTACIIIWMLVHDLIAIIKYGSMWFGIWLSLCFAVTTVAVVVQLINTKFRKKKPIHWAIKLAGYAAFYTVSLFAVMKLLGSYPGNWLSINKEYRELAYELYNLTLERYEYREISEGIHGQIILYFRNDNSFRNDKDISDQSLERTIKQRDHITIKNAVGEYAKINGGFQGERIVIEYTTEDLMDTEFTGHIYNFDPWTGEMGTDVPYWFVTDAHVNNCRELAEFYHDFSGICGSVLSMEGIEDLANLCNLTYLELNVSGMDKEDKDLEEQYLEELNTLLPDCEVHLNQYNIEIRPAWETFSD